VLFISGTTRPYEHLVLLIFLENGKHFIGGVHILIYCCLSRNSLGLARTYLELSLFHSRLILRNGDVIHTLEKENFAVVSSKSQSSKINW